MARHHLLIAGIVSGMLLSACSGSEPRDAAENEGLPAGSGTLESGSVMRQERAEGDVTVETPSAGSVVTSPLTVRGSAPGTWFFEASLPVRILDAEGNEIAIGPAQAQGEWMTEGPVPFSVTLSFAATTATGTLVIAKDNPSGEPENDASFLVPIRFVP